jgi:hypothetical protein
MSSFTKRARALLLFTAVALPSTSASGQQSAPQCQFEKRYSDHTSIEGDLFLRDDDPTIRGRLSLKIEADKVRPSKKDYLVSPTAMLGVAYSWDGQSLDNYAFEVRNPFIEEDLEAAPTFAATIDVDGDAHAFAMETKGFYSWNTLEGFAGGNGFGDLDGDITLSLAKTEASKAMTFSFDRKEAMIAYADAQVQLTELRQKHDAGGCSLLQRVTPDYNGTLSPFGCFLTTATCEEVGLDDDCWELRTLRKFRDGWLARHDRGATDIARYYREAPAIAARLKGDSKALLKLYWTRIVPSALAAQLGANRLARRIYTRMMGELTGV